MERTELKGLIVKAIIRFSMLPIFVGLLTLLPAGTFNYWQAYLYMAVTALPMIGALIYFLKRDPDFLVRRMKMRERQGAQKAVIIISTLAFLPGYILCGLDIRFGWSNMPVAVAVIGNLSVLLGYLFVLYVFKTNSYASRVVEVQEGQKVITTGPYSVVRHPMYSGILIMYLLTPIALGSYWAVIPFLLLPPLLVVRIVNEEKVLKEGLPGYKEYCEKVRFRLIPFFW